MFHLINAFILSQNPSTFNIPRPLNDIFRANVLYDIKWDFTIIQYKADCNSLHTLEIRIYVSIRSIIILCKAILWIDLE